MNKNAAKKQYEKLLFQAKLPDGSPDFDLVNDELRKNISLFLPKSLYRYRRCCEHDFDAFWNDKIFFSTPSNFNDPYDCLIRIDKKRIDDLLSELKNYDIIQELKAMRCSSHIITKSFGLNSAGPNKIYYDWIKNLTDDEFDAVLTENAAVDREKIFNTSRDLFKNINADLEQLFRKKVYLACFSENVDSILMWSHYADYHRGFALEYSGESLSGAQPCMLCGTKCQDEYRLSFLPIIYRNTRIDMTELLIELFGHNIHFAQLGKGAPFINPDHMLTMQLHTIKALFWKYEKEWRLVHASNQDVDKRRCTKIKPIAVYLGSKISPINKKILVDMAKAKNIKVVEMYEQPDLCKYKLSRRKINIS